MSRVYLDRGMILVKRGDYPRAADDLKRSSFAADKETQLYLALADFGAGKCEDGRYSLHLYQRTHDVDTETLVAAHRDFIAKTPCAESVLKE